MHGPGVPSPRDPGVDDLAVADCVVDFFGGDSSPRRRADAVVKTGIAVATNVRRSSSKCAENSSLVLHAPQRIGKAAAREVCQGRLDSGDQGG